MKKINVNWILGGLLLLGIVLLIYPSISNYVNTRSQTTAIIDYDEKISSLDSVAIDEEFEKAHTYNEQIGELTFPLLEYPQVDGYEEILNCFDDSVIGYLTIDSISVNLPIRHGTSDEVLSTTAGHLEGSSFPVGGKGTHSVISAHRGLPSSKLFTDLDRVAIGDTFTITVLSETLTYEVDQIRIVEPTDIDDLKIVPEQDYVTLMTCTPYGINTQRLLVRGKRVENPSISVLLRSEAYEVDPLYAFPVTAIPLFCIWMLVLLLKPALKRKND